MLKKLLLPIDGTSRSLKTISWVSENVQPDDVEVTIMMVVDSVDEFQLEGVYTSAQEYMGHKFEKYAQPLIDKGYTIHYEGAYGKAGDEICEYAKKKKMDAIILTKSTKKNWLDTIGSVTTYVVKYASTLVMIIPEK